MKLTELEPQFLKIIDPGVYSHVDSIDEAQGISLLCPKCFLANHGGVGTHTIICWFRGHDVPDDLSPVPGRWVVTGEGYLDLTLTPSIHLSGPGCGYHGFVTNGEVLIL